MIHSQADGGVDFCRVLVESYAVNERMNQIVLEHLDPAAWRAKLAGTKGRGSKGQGDAGDLCACPQCSSQVVEVVGAASEVAGCACPCELHAEAGGGGSG